jgi:hypothetical protein
MVVALKQLHQHRVHAAAKLDAHWYRDARSGYRGYCPRHIAPRIGTIKAFAGGTIGSADNLMTPFKA